MKILRAITFLLCFILFAGFFQNVSAATITPVSGSTADPVAYGSINNVIDNDFNYDNHLMLGEFGFNPWTGPYTVRFDLGQDYDLAEFNLWNNAGSIYNDGEGVDAFQLAFFDSSMTPVGTISQYNALDILTQQIFSIDALNVRFIDFIIQTNHSIGTTDDQGNSTERNYVDFYEVNFEGDVPSPVPVPATMLLLGSGLIGLAGIRRKVRKL